MRFDLLLVCLVRAEESSRGMVSPGERDLLRRAAKRVCVLRNNVALLVVTQRRLVKVVNVDGSVDGSYTAFSEKMGEIVHSYQGIVKHPDR